MDESNNLSLGLIVIDVQVGFINEYTRRVPEALLTLIRNVNFHSLVFTRFRNPKESIFRSAFSWHSLEKDEDISIVPPLLTYAQIVLDKTTYVPNIQGILNQIENTPVDQLYIAGIDTDVCVLLTAAALFDAGHEVKVLADCSMSTGGLSFHIAGLQVLSRIIGKANIIEDSSAHFRHLIGCI
jgi:nicotinamidase-related amidase